MSIRFRLLDALLSALRLSRRYIWCGPAGSLFLPRVIAWLTLLPWIFLIVGGASLEGDDRTTPVRLSNRLD